MDEKRNVSTTGKSLFEALMDDLHAGFLFISTQPFYLILPVIIDLIVWFGPRLRVQNALGAPLELYFKRVLFQLPASFRFQYTAAIRTVLDSLDSSNLIGALSFFPGSVPFYFAGFLPVSSPIGGAASVEVPGIGAFIGIFTALAVAGFLLGIAFYATIANRLLFPSERLTIRAFWRTAGRFALIILVGILAAAVFAFPLSFALVLLFPLGQIAIAIFILAAVLGLLLIIFPFLFVPAGIFAGLSLREAILVSRNLTANDVIGNVNFFVVSFVISLGLRNIWQIPDADSWMTLVSILGSAFITASLFAAYLVRFRTQLHNTRKISQFLARFSTEEDTNGK